MFLETFGLQGKALGTPRRALSRGQVSPVRIARYLFSVATPVTPVEPAQAATAEFLSTVMGEDPLVFTSVDGNGDNFKVVVFKETVFIPFSGLSVTYSIVIWDDSDSLVFNTYQTSLDPAIKAAQNAAALNGVLEVTAPNGLSEVVYSGSQFIGSATPVE